MISDNNNNIIIAIVIAKHLLRPYYMLGIILNVLNLQHCSLWYTPLLIHILQVKEIGPYLKTCPKRSQLESFKAAIWTQAIWLQNPCSSQHRLPRPEAPAAGRLGLNRHPPSPRGEPSDMRPEMQMSTTPHVSTEIH